MKKEMRFDSSTSEYSKSLFKERNSSYYTIVSPYNFVYTMQGFKKINELSSQDLVLGIEEPSGKLAWGKFIVEPFKEKLSLIKITSDRNEISLSSHTLIRTINEKGSLPIKAENVRIGNVLEMKIIEEIPSAKLFSDHKASLKVPNSGDIKIPVNEHIAYLLGVLNNVVKSLPNTLAIKIWGTYDEILHYAEIINEILCKTIDLMQKQYAVRWDYPAEIRFEEGPRYSWLIIFFHEEIPICFHNLLSYGAQGIVPRTIRLTEERIIKEYIAGIIDVGIEFDERWKTFRIPFLPYQSEIRRFLLDYLNLWKVYTIITKLSSPFNPWETSVYIDLREIERKCCMPFKRLLTRQAAELDTSEFFKQSTFYPKVRSKITELSESIRIHNPNLLWKPLVEWIVL